MKQMEALWYPWFVPVLVTSFLLQSSITNFFSPCPFFNKSWFWSLECYFCKHMFFSTRWPPCKILSEKLGQSHWEPEVWSLARALHCTVVVNSVTFYWIIAFIGAWGLGWWYEQRLSSWSSKITIHVIFDKYADVCNRSAWSRLQM